MSLFSTSMFDNIFNVLIKALVLFTALPIHECAHAWTAEKLGDSTAKEQGRITLNPFVHLDLFGAVCMLLTGFGWARPVQVNPLNFKNRKWGMALTSLAGPVSNILLATLTLMIYKVIAYLTYTSTSNFYDYFLQILSYMVLLNIGLAVFNLLPIPPLDGSRILTLVLPERLYFKIMRYEQYIFIGLILVMFSGFLDKPLMVLRQLILSGMNWMTGFVDIIMKAIV